MKKILIVSVALVCFNLSLNAQGNSGHLKEPKRSTYISVAFGSSYFKNKVSDPGGKFYARKFKTPTLGVLIEQEVSPRLSIETGIVLRSFRTSLVSDCDVLNLETSVFQVPIRLNYTLWEKGKFKLKAYAGLNMSFQDVGRSGTLTGPDLSYDFQSDGPSVLIAPEVGLRLDYQVNQRIKLGLYASYVISNRNLDQTVMNYSVDGNAPIQAISNSRGSYFQTGFRVSYLLR